MDERLWRGEGGGVVGLSPRRGICRPRDLLLLLVAPGKPLPRSFPRFLLLSSATITVDLAAAESPFSVPFISRWQYPAGRLSGYPRRSSRLVEAKRNQGSRGAPTKSIHPKQQEHTRAEQRAQHPHQHQQFSISNRRKTSPALPEPRPVKKSSLRVCRGPPDDARPDRETGKGSRGRAQRQRDGSRKKNINYIISLRQGRNLAVRPRPAATKGTLPAPQQNRRSKLPVGRCSLSSFLLDPVLLLPSLSVAVRPGPHLNTYLPYPRH